MKKFIILLAVFVLGACATQTEKGTQGQTTAQKQVKAPKVVKINLPLPKDLKIVSPSADVPKEMARFSGKWHGSWDGNVECMLIVEEINPPEAKVVYSWGDAPDINIVSGWTREKGKFANSATLKIPLSWGAMITAVWKADGTLDANYKDAQYDSYASMKRIE